MKTTLSRSVLEQDLRTGAFAAPRSAASIPPRVGAEAEFIPVETHTGRRCPIEGEDQISTLPFLRRYGQQEGWEEGRTPKGTPCFSLAAGGILTFEPGGQLEYSSPPCVSASALLSLLRSVVLPLRAAASQEGISLLTCGIDPLNSIEQVPLLLQAKRYVRMSQYFERRGSAGARMMRQTAAFQISVDFTDEPWLRWRVLNAAAPYITAIFANSPIYAGEHTGTQSARAAVWREVDSTRTGIHYDEQRPIEAYLEFALAAPAILLPEIDGDAVSFDEWLTRADPTLEHWHEHLTTLFPEVRPRGHLELRSIDALDPHWYAAPVAVATGLYDPVALRAANELLGNPDSDLLDRGSREGLHDPLLRQTAADLFEIALAGCRRLGADYFHASDLDEATAFYERYTRVGRAPADELGESAIAA